MTSNRTYTENVLILQLISQTIITDMEIQRYKMHNLKFQTTKHLFTAIFSVGTHLVYYSPPKFTNSMHYLTNTQKRTLDCKVDSASNSV